MSTLKQTISVHVAIADVLLKGEMQAAADALNIEFEKQGIPKGTPVEVEIKPEKYWYVATATWSPS